MKDWEVGIGWIGWIGFLVYLQNVPCDFCIVVSRIGSLNEKHETNIVRILKMFVQALDL